MRHLYILLVVLPLIIGRSVQGQTVTLYSDKTAWSSDLANLGLNEESLATTPTNMTLADEITSTPGINSPLGPTLHWNSGNTGLSLDFQLDAVNVCADDPSRALVYSDNEMNFPSGQRLISIGDINGVGTLCPEYENDDFDIRVFHPGGSQCGILALGVEFVANGATAGESLSIYGENDALLMTFTSGWPGDDNPNVGHFVGILSTYPVTRFSFDEDAGGDDMAIRDFSFGTACGPVASETSSWGSMKSTYR